MADNLTTTTTVSTIPSGTVISTDDAGASGHVQRVKLALSADGSAAHATVDADGVLVNLGANNDVTVTGTVTANAGTNLNTSTLATEATLDARTGTLTETAPATDTASSGLNGRLQRIAQRLTSLIALWTQGGGTEATALRVTLANDSTGLVSVDDNAGSLTVDGTVTANLAAGANNIGDVDVLTLPADPLGANADAVVAAGATGSISAKLRRLTQGVEDLKTTIVLAAGSAAIGKLSANSGVDIGDVDVMSVVLPTTNATSAVTSVADTATSTTLLSASAARKGFRIYNDSTAALFVKYGTTASATDFTVKLAADGYLEENFYSGRVDGIWASDASGSARITSLSA